MVSLERICFACSVSLFLVVIPVYGSIKKGVGAWAGTMLCDDFKALNNMTWWYDWHMDLKLYHKKVTHHCPYGTDKTMPAYVPMVKMYDNHTHLNISSSAQFILGFNEPDHGELTMTPQEAADAWPEIEKHSHGLPLVSPCTAGRNFPWFDEFLRLCKGCRIDYIAAHIYNCDAHVIMSYLRQLHHRYNKKIWLTEFACPQATDVHQQLHLMQTLLPQLEAADFVFRYAWFSARRVKSKLVGPEVSLLHNDSATLTMIGHYYNNFQGNVSPIVG